jgi:hypothetical protein
MLPPTIMIAPTSAMARPKPVSKNRHKGVTWRCASSWLDRRFWRLAHRLRIACDHQEVGTRGLIRPTRPCSESRSMPTGVLNRYANSSC